MRTLILVAAFATLLVARPLAAQETALIPYPADITYGAGEGLAVGSAFQIHVADLDPLVVRTAHALAATIEQSLGFYPMVRRAGPDPRGGIVIDRVVDASLGSEGYRLSVSGNAARLVANDAAGLFYGVQTLRQFMPADLSQNVLGTRRSPHRLRAVEIVDVPRFGWRGAMLDVSRHFFGVDVVKEVIDYLAMYKMNRLHLHLSDDQGWRIEIRSWPNLALHGGSTEVGGGPGGYFTQDDYREIVRYAGERFITIVPEIDMPGHTNAALASYPELNCDGVAPELYTGIRVGFSSLCVDEEITYQFVSDVLSEIAAMTPTPYLHIGGDEVEKLTQEQYNMFIERVQEKVLALDRRMVGWDEIAHAELHPTTIVQHWRPRAGTDELRGANWYIMSPADRAYLDMKYDSTTTLGLAWAGYISTEHGYTWDPATMRDGITEDKILGVESPLWTETVETIEHIQYLFFPRLPGYAEIGWTPQERRSWDEYRQRLAIHGVRWDALGITFHRDAAVDWVR